ncbi:MAG TPA: dihydroorotate dehydrogenase electron transfer subunit [Polyangiaceae bacterium]|jgi:dihydroorotate dehydrogenase electron transfer subunit|nr:dihydroorotate dehydrogenase electron transfer subunit [Polyangiaceae bacterium]
MANETQGRELVTVPLLRRESIGDQYHVLTFDVPQGVSARAGQFTMLRGAEWGDAPLLPRPMSYLTAGATPSVLIKVLGEGTARMARSAPGEPFTLLGPLGNTWQPPSAGRRPLLVAGGVGIAPLLFFARELNAAGIRPIAIYGGRTARDLPLEDELVEVADIHVTTEDGSRGRRGRVTDALPELASGETEIYACGPDRMMAAVAEQCAARHLRCDVSLETPMACGYGVCLGCPVPLADGSYLYACMQGPCVDAARIAWGAGGHAPVRKELRGTP